MPSLTALVGAATAAYSAVLVAAPGVLIRPAGLSDTRDTRALTRVLGARDVALGVLLAAAPAGPARTLVTAARVLADGSDAVVFGTALAGQRRRWPVAASAAALGGLVLLAGVLDRRAGR